MKLSILVDNHALQGFHGEHGLSILLEDGSGSRVLFDTGASGTVLLRNAAGLAQPLKWLNGLMLSHGHYDHTGGLNTLIGDLRGVSIYCHPQLFQHKLKKDGRDIGTEITEREIEYCGLRLMMDRAPQKIAESFLTTGQIERTCPYEPEPQGFLIEKEGRCYTDVMLDEEALIARTGKGLVVVVGCAHPGVINTLKTASKVAGEPIYAVVGGFHLGGASDDRIERTVADLKAMNVQRIYPGHCTGEKAVEAIKNAFGENCTPIAAGLTIDI